MKPLNNFEKELFNNMKRLYFPFLVIKKLREVRFDSPKDELKWQWKLLKTSNYPVSRLMFYSHVLESFGPFTLVYWIYNDIQTSNTKVAPKS